MIYLDNGATSFPKPPQVTEAVFDVMTNYCANPGRAGHFMAARTAQEIFRTRLALARLFNIEDPGRLVFTKNCTESLNMAITGVLRPGDHVITTSMEHNSVIRPLARLQKAGVELEIIRCDSAGRLSADDIRKALKTNTKMIVMTAASNVTGTKMPLKDVGRIALRRGLIFLVDAAQGAGCMDIDVRRDHIDMLAAPGHKGLMGPQGTGVLYVREGIELRPLMTGGTGTSSKEAEQPLDFPEGFEAGTVNAPGIIGLGAAVRFINKIGSDAIELHERRLTEKLQEGLCNIDGVTVYGPQNVTEKAPVVAFNIDGMDCEDASSLLNDRYGIAVRAGFHCSGVAHKTIGTEETGCIRACPGFYTSECDIEEALKAVAEIARSRSQGRP